MTGRRRVILLDTNIIIEAVRTRCWNGLRGQYHLVTVEKCREEAQSGGHRARGYVVVEDRHLDSGIEIVEDQASVSDYAVVYVVSDEKTEAVHGSPQ